jgi:hypothetical protein
MNSTAQKMNKNWKNVINQSDLASNSSSSQLVIRRNENSNINCLSPEEVRALIMKKRSEKLFSFNPNTQPPNE